MRTPITAAALMLIGLVWVPAATTATDAGPAECVRPSGVQRIVFGAQKFPNVRRHFRGALRRGWPRRLVVNRRGADARRERALRDIPTREGFDRDEYPPAVGRGRGPGWSVVATRAAGRPTCATCPAPRTDHRARRSETDSNPSATAPAFATCSADSLSGSPPSTDAEVLVHEHADRCRPSARCPGRDDVSWATTTGLTVAVGSEPRVLMQSSNCRESA
jgi:hypothetical protein